MPQQRGAYAGPGCADINRRVYRWAQGDHICANHVASCLLQLFDAGFIPERAARPSP